MREYLYKIQMPKILKQTNLYCHVNYVERFVFVYILYVFTQILFFSCVFFIVVFLFLSN